jgi:energy-coupling factor transporter ATP-binding protein EcfA2
MLINKEWGPWVKGLSTVGGTVAALTVLYRNRLTAAALLRYSQYPACYVQSIRTPDICRIKEALETLEYGQERFILLFGPTGVGKTTALSSGVAHRPGVFRVDVNHRMKADDISLVQRHVWFYTSFQQHVPTAAQNVINMYNLIWPPPLVVLDLVNKQEIAATPYVLEAARRLSRKGFKVIVDACEGTLIPDESGFSRARIIYLGYMDWEQIQQIPQFGKLLQTIEKHQLTALVQEVIGGSPLLLEDLRDSIGTETTPENTKADIKKFLRRRVGAALKKFVAFTSEAPAAGEVLKLFQTHESVPVSSFQGIVLPANHLQVLRFRETDYVARTPAMRFLLKHNITKVDQFSVFGL